MDRSIRSPSVLRQVDDEIFSSCKADRGSIGALARDDRDFSFASGRLWSLWKIMQRFAANVAFDICGAASRLSIQWKADDAVIEDELRSKQIKIMESYISGLYPLGLSASCATIKKLKEKFQTDGCRRKEIAKLSEELLGRLVDETQDKIFFCLLPREAEFYENPSRGWEAGIKRFSIRDDVEEASKCFALSRYAAAVFHSLQVVEAALIELGTFIKVADPKSGWTAVSKALEAIIKKPHQNRTRFEKKNFAFLEQVQGTVEGLKNAWRNKISHTHGRLVLMTTDFSPEIAEEILFATRAFVRRLAEGISTPASKEKGVSSRSRSP